MRSFLECIPCLVRQTLESLTYATSDLALRESILREALRQIAEMPMHESPPHMATVIHRMIRERCGCDDPYKDVKARSNNAALALLPRMREMVRNAPDPFEAAVRLSIAGNVIDFGTPNRPPEDDFTHVAEEALTYPMGGMPVSIFREAVRRAKPGGILFLGDNAGEIVFDKLLLEALAPQRCVYALRRTPVLNDATLAEGHAVGLDAYADLVDNGSDAPGTILEWCSAAFRERFAAADLVIAKGQGNYETLSECGRGNVFFLFKAKCPVVARHLNQPLGHFILTSTPGDKPRPGSSPVSSPTSGG